MIDFNSEIGKEAKRLLQNEYILWLTTVSQDGTPQPRPVWFIWDNDAVLIYSKPSAAKLKHIARNPRVALHFNADREGGEGILVLIGDAVIEVSPPRATEVPAYLKKYESGIASIDMTPQSFAKTYSVAIRVDPQRVRD